jgi:hypothetical protein
MYRYSRAIRPFDPTKKLSRAELGNVSWRDELLEYAAQLDRLQPYDLEAFCLQRLALARGLRRLARRYAS